MYIMNDVTNFFSSSSLFLKQLSQNFKVYSNISNFCSILRVESKFHRPEND